MRFLCLGLLAVASNVAGPVMSYAQTPPASQTGQNWILPASLAGKKLPDVLVEQTKGEIDAILGTAAGDNNKLTTVTEGLVLSLPSSLPQVVSKAVQANTTETASAMGLGLCMATSSLMNAANDPATIPAESQSARNLARAILANVAAASQASATANAGISNSFGISTTSSGGTSISCKAIGGEVIATAAVNAAAPSSSAGVGAATTSGEDGTFVAGAADEVTSGGGQKHVSYSSGVGARLFTAANADSAGASTIAVPGPEAGAGLMSLMGFGAVFAVRSRRAQHFIRMLQPVR